MDLPNIRKGTADRQKTEFLNDALPIKWKCQKQKRPERIFDTKTTRKR